MLSVVKNRVRLDYAIIGYQEPIIHILFNKQTELGFPEVRDLIRHSQLLSGGKPYVVLSELQISMKLTKEGRKVASNPVESPLHRGTALLVKSSMFQIATNFFSHFSKPPFPFHAFTNKQEAIDWLLKIPLSKPGDN